MFDLTRSELLGFAKDVSSSVAARKFQKALDADRDADGGESRNLPRSLPQWLDLLAELAEQSPKELHHAFGRRLFERFAIFYPDFIPSNVSALDFLEGVERHVHDELRSIYPGARPPRLDCERLSETRLIIRYFSASPAEELCVGMLEATLDHFETRATILRRPPEKGADAVFELVASPDE
ncbi:MAG: heme NO-binding domain-containing protein [Pikeienuella sp.]